MIELSVWNIYFILLTLWAVISIIVKHKYLVNWWYDRSEWVVENRDLWIGVYWDIIPEQDWDLNWEEREVPALHLYIILIPTAVYHMVFLKGES